MKKVLSGLLMLYIVYWTIIGNSMVIFVFDTDITRISFRVLINILFFGIYLYGIFSTRWEDKKIFNNIISIVVSINTIIFIYDIGHFGQIIFLGISLVIVCLLWNRSRRFNNIINAIILVTYLGAIIISVPYIMFEVSLYTSNSKIIGHKNNEIITKESKLGGDKSIITYERIFLNIYKSKGIVYDYNYKDTD